MASYNQLLNKTMSFLLDVKEKYPTIFNKFTYELEGEPLIDPNIENMTKAIFTGSHSIFVANGMSISTPSGKQVDVITGIDPTKWEADVELVTYILIDDNIYNCDEIGSRTAKQIEASVGLIDKDEINDFWDQINSFDMRLGQNLAPIVSILNKAIDNILYPMMIKELPPKVSKMQILKKLYF